jgi:hypothetical protein
MNPALTAVPGNIQKALEQSVGIAEMLRRPAQNQNLLNIVVGSRDHLADFVDLLGKLSKAVAKLSTHLVGGGNQTVPEPVARVRLRNIISALGVPEMAMKEGRLDGSLGSVRLTPQERKGTPAVQAIKSLLEARGVTLSVDSKNNLERIVSGPPLASF